MKCPLDAADLLTSYRQGVAIDYCPTCRGIWLDRGELDKIIEFTAIETKRWRDRSSARMRRRERDGFVGELFESDR